MNLTRALQVRAQTVNDEERTVEATISTEQPVEVYDAQRGQIIDEVLLVGGASLPSQMPLLANHSRASLDSIIGSVRDIRADGGSILGRLYFATDPESERAWQKVRAGHITDVSVGYRVLDPATTLNPGQSATVAGRTYTAGKRTLRVAQNWQPKEVSLVPIGADQAAKIREDQHFIFRSESMSSVSAPSVIDTIGREAPTMRFAELATIALKSRGMEVPRNDKDACREWVSSVAGMADLSGLVNSSVLSGFRSEPDTTAGWVRVVNLPNFLPAQLGRIEIAPRLGRVSRGQAAPVVGFGIGAQGWRLARFGCAFAIGEEDLLDAAPVGVLLLALEEIGRAARRLVPDLVYSLLLANAALSDGVAIFHATHGNVGSAALADSTLDAGMAAISDRVDTGEDELPVHRSIAPVFLLTPGGLSGLARRLNWAMGSPLTVRAESRLGTAGVVNPASDEIVAGNAANWLLTPSSDQAPSVVIGARDSRVDPVVTHWQLEAGRWGVGFGVKLDLAATVADPASMYMSRP